MRMADQTGVLRESRARAGRARTRPGAPVREAIVYGHGPARRYAALVVSRIVTVTALGVDEERYVATLGQRYVDFLAALIGSGDERLTYDLRLLSAPDAAVPSRGLVTAAVLCRMDGLSNREARARARALQSLVEAFFPEYDVELASSRRVRHLLEPFPVRQLVAIGRRADLVRLDSFPAIVRRPIGFVAGVAEAGDRAARRDTVFHVFPFASAAGRFAPVLRMLRDATAPVAVSVRLRPAMLTSEEIELLEAQMTRCEAYAQVEVRGGGDDPTVLWPALREQARLHQLHQARWLAGLRDRAVVMTVELASPAPIPVEIVHAVGTLVTAPSAAPAEVNRPDRCLAGGYDVTDRSGSADAAVAFSRLEVLPVSHPLAPRGGTRLVALFDPLEASAAFRLPPATREPLPGVEARHCRIEAGPRDLPAEGCLLGVTAHGRAHVAVRIAPDDRRRHAYVVGQTGTGKTTLLETMILDDMRAGRGVCVVDPHGDLFRALLGKVPVERIEDVVLLDPTDVDWPPGLNLLEHETVEQRHFLVQELVGIVMRLVADEFGAASLGQIAGPVFLQHVRMNLLLAMSDHDDPGTLVEFHTIFQEDGYWRRWLPLKTTDPMLERWVSQALPRSAYTRPGSDNLSMGGYVGSKFEGFVFDPLLRNIFGQKRSTIDLRSIMDRGRILLVNLAKGELTETNARFLGMVLLAKLIAAAMGRIAIPAHDRREFHVYVDEFQSLATAGFVTLLSEARKFGLSLVLANQFLTQVEDSRIVDAIFGNVGSVVSLRVGHQDAERLEREFLPVFNRFDLTSLPNWQACVRLLIGGQVARPFSLATRPDPAPFVGARAETVRARSRARYGRPRADVDAEIARSLRSPGD